MIFDWRATKIVPALPTIIENLAKAQREFLFAADEVSAEQWKLCPGEGRWSAAEVVAHVIMVERAIVRSTDKLLQKPPAPLPFFKRWHIPMVMVESRWIRRKSPIPLDPQMVGPKEEMLAQVREVRGRSLAFLEETKGRNLSKYHWPHPFLGMLNGYEWFQMIASHQLRHTKQMKEISADLPKIVTTLQK
ncbi:MAG TPA: DinB family protein [Methylomirabilota bacterium]|nr:DinB family protein [Methylomirabilota bacterium]